MKTVVDSRRGIHRQESSSTTVGVIPVHKMTNPCFLQQHRHSFRSPDKQPHSKSGATGHQNSADPGSRAASNSQLYSFIFSTQSAPVSLDPGSALSLVREAYGLATRAEYEPPFLRTGVIPRSIKTDHEATNKHLIYDKDNSPDLPLYGEAGADYETENSLYTLLEA